MGTTLDLRVCVATLSLYRPSIDRPAFLCEAAHDRSWDRFTQLHAWLPSFAFASSFARPVIIERASTNTRGRCEICICA